MKCERSGIVGRNFLKLHKPLPFLLAIKCVGPVASPVPSGVLCGVLLFALLSLSLFAPFTLMPCCQSLVLSLALRTVSQINASTPGAACVPPTCGGRPKLERRSPPTSL